MPEEFGTINVRSRAERAREIEVIRQQYQRHRTALEEMIADAPTEHLATEYQRLSREIEAALAKLAELEGRGPVPAASSGPATAAPQTDDLLRMKTEPGMRRLVDDGTELPLDDEPERGSRVALMIGAGIAALLLIGWLIWRASSDRDADAPIVEDTVATDSGRTVTQTQPVAAPPLTVTPATHDYGVIRKGTRATRQFEIANQTEEPVTIQIARSECRCLYYEHAEVIPPKASESVTVTVDGARAKAGTLLESIQVTAKSDPTIATTMELSATIR